MAVSKMKSVFNAPEEALGKGITINNHIYEVIGVIDENSIRKNAESNVDNMYSTFYLCSSLTSTIFTDSFFFIKYIRYPPSLI